MPFRSGTQPLCRYCGKSIKKYTTTIYFGKSAFESEFLRSLPDKPVTIEAAQKHTNQQIMSHRWQSSSDGRWISRLTIWDGESYDDEFFCTGDDAKRFAYMVARHTTLSTDDYKMAKKQKDTTLDNEDAAWAHFDKAGR